MNIYDENLLKAIKEKTTEPKVIFEKRKRAFLDFKNLDMPRGEDWKYTHLELNLNEFVPKKDSIIFNPHEDIIICDMKTALEKHFDIIKEHLVDYKKDKIGAMHAAFWDNGLFIYVPKNVSGEAQVRFIVDGAHYAHTLIVLEENSSLKYISRHTSKNSGFRNDSTSVFAKANSRINYINLQNWKHDVVGFNKVNFNLERDSSAVINFCELGGKFSRVHIDCNFNGEGSSSETYGGFFSNNKQQFDMTTNANHNVRNTTSNILVKGILDDESYSVYRGKINILKQAQNTNSYLSDHNLVISDKAKSYSIPSLQIDANEVSASHGATIGKPDKDEIFYLKTRGLSDKEAEKLIIQGFLSDVVTQDIEDEFYQAINAKIR